MYMLKFAILQYFLDMYLKLRSLVGFPFCELKLKFHQTVLHILLILYAFMKVNLPRNFLRRIKQKKELSSC
jgi:hypothetical protein